MQCRLFWNPGSSLDILCPDVTVLLIHIDTKNVVEVSKLNILTQATEEKQLPASMAIAFCVCWWFGTGGRLVDSFHDPILFVPSINHDLKKEKELSKQDPSVRTESRFIRGVLSIKVGSLRATGPSTTNPWPKLRKSARGSAHAARMGPSGTFALPSREGLSPFGGRKGKDCGERAPCLLMLPTC